ncbi:hypothetical protein M569_07239, partial [Genlisea aurea]
LTSPNVRVALLSTTDTVSIPTRPEFPRSKSGQISYITNGSSSFSATIATYLKQKKAATARIKRRKLKPDF